MKKFLSILQSTGLLGRFAHFEWLVPRSPRQGLYPARAVEPESCRLAGKACWHVGNCFGYMYAHMTGKPEQPPSRSAGTWAATAVGWNSCEAFIGRPGTCGSPSLLPAG